MDLKLTGKKALITGSTSGIGFAIAKTLAEEGATVVLNGRKQAGIDAAIDALKGVVPDANVSGLQADFMDVEEVNALIGAVGEIDILVNNVGIFSAQSFEETPDEDWQKMFDVNVMSGVRLSRALLPSMLEKKWGRILFISSECAMLVPDDLIAYSMTKAAMLCISRGLAQLTRGTEVTVNSVMPGSTLSEGAKNLLKEMAERDQITEKEVEQNFFTNVRTTSLLARFASTDEIATTVAYLASPLAVATNGACIKADGGAVPGIL